MELLTTRYAENLTGVLSCYDRIVITGTLPGACFADGMTSFLPLLNSVWVDSMVFWLAAGVKGAKRRSEPLTPAASRYAGRHGRCGMLTHRP